MTNIGEVLAAAAVISDEGGGRFRAPAALQSWPGIVHGGALVGLLDAAACRLGTASGPRLVEGRLTSSVPVETDLPLGGGSRDGVVSVSVLRNETPLAAAIVRPLAGPVPAPGGTTVSPRDGLLLPTFDRCLACGAANPLGLRVRLRFDEEAVGARVEPPPAWVARGALHPAAAAVLLDETAWWLGALATQQGGLTNRITLWIQRLPFPAGPVVAAGRLRDVEPVGRHGTFCRTLSTLGTESGEPLATAAIVFRGSAEYSERQLPHFRTRSGEEAFARMFPSHAAGRP